MSRWSRLPCAAIAVLALAVPAFGDFYSGLDAYDRGDYAEALREWRPLAEAGDPSAQANLGVLYWRGEGVQEDHVEAVRWFRLAAEQGNSIAQDNLGQMYYLGQGVERSEAEAAYWIRAAAVQGDAGAQLRLGSLYAEGIGVERNPETAVLWWRRSADQGNAEAGVRLGIAYERGTGVEKDPEQARAWFERAALAPDAAGPDPVARGAAGLPADVPPAALGDAAEAAAFGGNGAVMVQLASVGSPEDARAVWDRLRGEFPDLLNALEVDLERVDLGERGVFHRVRAGPLPDRARAEALCAELRSRQQDCWVAAGP